MRWWIARHYARHIAERPVARERANVHMSFNLASTLERAGLTLGQVRAEAIVQTPSQHHPVGPILRAMLERIERHGVATREQIDVVTSDQRLTEERRQANATYIGEMVFGAWGPSPAPDRAPQAYRQLGRLQLPPCPGGLLRENSVLRLDSVGGAAAGMRRAALVPDPLLDVSTCRRVDDP